ncbi:MAG: class I SAM-dependent methyltransferase, partial [bacterium]
MGEATAFDLAESLNRSQDELLHDVQRYWSAHLHDAEISPQPIGTEQFFRDLKSYRDEKQVYLSRIIDFEGFEKKKVLELGCGMGFDVIRFVARGALVTGVDLSTRAVRLAKKNLAYFETPADVLVMNGEELQFTGDSFDVVYSYSVLHFTPDPKRMVAEIHRVLRPGGTAILMVYNRYSWLVPLSKLTGVKLQHSNAPVFRNYSQREFKELLGPFQTVRVIS